MNYRHAFHAGNHADILKHAILAFVLESLRRKPAPYAALDTHAGRGCYDLASAESARSPEWRDGVGKLLNWDAPPPLVARLLRAVRAQNQDDPLRRYPGSPLLIASSLRSEDVLMACERHPEEFAALRQLLPRAANVQLHDRDGWEAIGALLPPKQKRGLVLIDPPYEAADDFDRAIDALEQALKRFGHGLYLWWRPLKLSVALDRADEAFAHRALLRADLWIDTPAPEGKLVGSSVLAINPPFGLEAELRAALPALVQRLAIGDGAGWRVITREP